MQANPQAFYQTRVDLFQKEIDGLKGQIKQLAIFRLLFFSAIFGAIFWVADGGNLYSVGSLVGSIIIFFALVQKNFRLRKKKKFKETQRNINLEEIGRLSGIHEGLESGKNYLDLDHSYSGDLDLFGEGSLFQFLHRCPTVEGSKQLASWLLNKADIPEIHQRQTAIKELAEKPEFREVLRATGMLANESQTSAQDLKNWIKTPAQLLTKRLFIACTWVLPAIAFIALGLGIAGLAPWSLFIFVFVVNLSFSAAQFKKLENSHGELSKQFKAIEGYSRQFSFIESESFSSERLDKLKNDLTAENTTASAEIKKLSGILSALDNAGNVFIFVTFNGLLLWSTRHAIRLEKWQKANKENVLRWLSSLAEMDALSSLGGYAFNNPNAHYPTPQPEFSFSAKSLAHPLLPEKERVANDVELEEWSRFLLITGSNMAGKSTFLRTVGINLVLAMTGAPVAAEKLVFSPVGLVTSMRIGDSLQNRESTFYAELKRLKLVIDAAKKEPVFIILDEMLKGTNSHDKLIGSRALIEQLVEYKSAGLVATHDLALADLEAQYPKNIRNVHFNVDLDGDYFHFDYKLKSGVCQTMNATQLMRKMGISVEQRSTPVN